MDTTTVIGVLDNEDAVGQAMSSLREAGFGDLEVLKGGEAEIAAEVRGRDFGEEQARAFAKAAAGGKVLLAVSTSEEKADRALELLQRKPAPAPASAGGGEAVQVVEEELEVGKRKVATGGVRVTSSVSEVPVEETVTLREEKVAAERKNVDRELSPEEAEAAFKGRTVEATSTSEEAEVSKQARVVGEVSIGKQTKEREETVRDTVRRTEVEVEKVEAGVPKAR
jgi:uncharacterized protein (TIGR02271 family)